MFLILIWQKCICMFQGFSFRFLFFLRFSIYTYWMDLKKWTFENNAKKLKIMLKWKKVWSVMQSLSKFLKTHRMRKRGQAQVSNTELHTMYSSASNMREMWAGYVQQTWQRWEMHTHKVSYDLRDLGIDGRIILKCIWKKMTWQC